MRRPLLSLVLAAATGVLAACGSVGAGDEGPEATTTQNVSAEADGDGQSGDGTDDAVDEDGVEETRDPVTVTIVAAGDILPHASVNANANANAGGAPGEFDFAPMFAEVAPLIEEADLAVCHLETPLSADNTALTQPRVLVFNSPREVATGLRSAGFDSCDFASNHTWDRGLRGLAETIDVVEDAGMAYAGPQADESRAGEAARHELGEVTVAHLAYTYTVLNNWGPNTDVPSEAPWVGRAMWPVVEADGIIADADAARADGADLVVVSMHWGEEYVATPTADQRRLARELLEDGAVDLILGTHVHVIQPCETINGRTVFYGLGNFLSNQSPETARTSLPVGTQEGMIARASLTVGPDGSVTSEVDFQPTRVNLQGHVIELATQETHPETYARTVDTLASIEDGVCDAVPR